jgi:hypothetical protein
MIYKTFNEINLKKNPIIIIGSGPAGMTLALELEKKKISTIVLEAGAEDFDEESQKIYKTNFVSDKLTDTSVSRLRQLGGTSGHWGGWSKPLEDVEIEKWPIRIKELNLYKEESCKILDIENQFRKSSINNFLNQIEFQYSKVKFYDKYKNHLKNSKYINIFLNTQLLYFSGENNKIKQAICFSNGQEIILNSNLFILACGGIENSRILLWTKEKSKNILNRHQAIGNYWMTHSWILSGIGIISLDKLKEKMSHSYLNYEGPLHFSATKEFIDEKKIASAGLYIESKEKIIFYKEIVKDLLCVAPDFGKKFANNIFKKNLKCGNVFMHIEDKPNKNNRIYLSKKNRDKFNIPVAEIDYITPKDSIITAKNFMSEFANICRRESLGRIAMHEDIYNLKKMERLGEFHHMGGTRMGESIKNSVVDRNLKVHDVDNLFVAGSSVFVTCGYTNPTFTIIQLSIRLSEHIKNNFQI